MPRTSRVLLLLRVLKPSFPPGDLNCEKSSSSSLDDILRRSSSEPTEPAATRASEGSTAQKGQRGDPMGRGVADLGRGILASRPLGCCGAMPLQLQNCRGQLQRIVCLRS